MGLNGREAGSGTRLSVIVPSANGAPTLGRCLEAIEASMRLDDELIVVDGPAGGAPAQRRNDGARRATGDVLVFIDADVVAHPSALDRIRAAFADDQLLAGVFGCYDDSPPAPGVVSRFRNLLHHYVHVESEGPASTFWSGLGGIRRDVFLASGGFDATRYPRPMVEDVELGLRIGDAGGRIELRRDIRGTHLKDWTLSEMLQSDLLNRGVPWAQLILERRHAPATLNLAWRHRFSALAYLGLVVTPLAGPRLGRRRTVATGSALVVTTLALNHRLYALLLRRGGPRLSLTGLVLHGAHHLAGLAAVPVALAGHVSSSRDGARRRRRSRAGTSTREGPREKTLPETGCVLPWLHAATLTDGSVQLCCVSGGGSGVNLNEQTLADYWNSPYVRDARRRMLAGKRVAACEGCYLEEAHGRRSHRIVENEVWLKRWGADAISDLIARTAADGTLDAPIQYVDLRLGNTCNMRCVMCQPRESSRWLPLARRLSELSEDAELTTHWRRQAGIDQDRFSWYRNAEFWSSLQSFLPALREVILAGGEPFLIKQQTEFVRACCELGEAHHIKLQYHTNGTVFPEGLTRYWEQFEHVQFLISVDGVGEVADYVRHPSDWEHIVANVRRFDALPDNTLMQFHCTVHALNLYRLPDVLEWADTAGLRNRNRFSSIQQFVGTGLVKTPAHQDVRVLPAEFKRRVTRRLTEYIASRPVAEPTAQLNSILVYMNSADCSRRMPQLIHHSQLLDRIHGSDVLATFPELAPFWDHRCH